MDPPTTRPLPKHRKFLAAVPSFQIEAYERGRLKSFPPRAAPIPQVIRFKARSACPHARGGGCKHCSEQKNHVVSEGSPDNVKTKIGHASIEFPEMSPEIDWTITHSSHYRALSWWPSLSNSKCSEHTSSRGIQVSRDLFQAIVHDEMSSDALSGLVDACDLISTPSVDPAEKTRKILNQKQRVFSMLRKRLETEEPETDQVIMTIFFLLTLELLDDTRNTTFTWDLHLHAIARLVEPRNGQLRLAFRPHFKSRTDTHIEYLGWMKKQEAARSIDNSGKRAQRAYPYHPFPVSLTNRIHTLPVGFTAMAKTTLLSLGTIDLTERTCALNALLAAQSLPLGANDELIQLVKETNFRCNDLMLPHESNRVETILVLGLTSYCQYIGRNIFSPSGFSTMGLGISLLLSKLSCTLLARHHELMTPLDLASPSVRNAMLWAGSMLVVTTSRNDSARALGQRLLRLCQNDPVPEPKRPGMWKAEFVWPDTLPVLQL